MIMKRIIYLGITILSFVIPSTAFSQCGNLSGHVFDADEKIPLEFAGVFIKELSKGTTTNEKGEYSIENVCDGRYTVTISHVGCGTKDVIIEVKGNAHKDFHLPHTFSVLKEICVTERAEQKPTQTVSEISGRDLEQVKGENLGESLKKVSGVTTLETGSSISKPVIHGLHSNRILILNNGIRQEGQQWGSEHAPEIDPFIANKLTVVKGANAVKYGSDAIAGVILVEPAELRDSAGINGELNLVGFSNNRQGVISSMIQQNFRKIPSLSWRLQGTLKQAGNSRTPDYWLKNTGFKEYNFSYAIAFKKENYGSEVFYSQFNNTIGIFSGAHIGNLTDLKAAFSRSQPLDSSGFTYAIGRPYQHIEHELVKSRSYVRTGHAGLLFFTYARQYNLRNEFDKHRPLRDSVAALERPALQYEITTHTGDLVWEHSRIGSLTGSVGVSGMKQGNTYEGRLFIPNYLSSSAGLFLIERWKRDRLEVEGGIRYDLRKIQVFRYNSAKVLEKPEHDFANLSGTLGTIYRFNPHFRFSLNAGTAWRAPAVSELYSNGLHHGAAAIEIGNNKLTEERAMNFIASANYHDHKKLNIELSFYYNIINDFIYLKPTLTPTLTIRGAFPTFQYEQVNADFKGVDLTASYYLLKNLQFTTKASVLRAYNRSIDDHLIMMPSDRIENELTFEFKKLAFAHEPYIGVSVLSVGKQFRVPANSDFAPVPEAYNLLNADLGFALRAKDQLIRVSVVGHNLLNTVYRDYLNRFRYYADATGRNISLKVTIPFNKNYKPKNI